ncbi:MAG TPA: hypothetical protein VGQ58_09190 [Candidatus Limnocylindrales bacterium]|jgi:hypothetical protein|nr:hypothetical protein [Candidatus Limnocylindrales bacterium]
MAVDVLGGRFYAPITGASGIRHLEIQFTPPTVWRAIRDAKAAKGDQA